MSVELIPCPFCGDLAWVHCHLGVLNSQDGWRVECEGYCHSMTCYWHTREQAVDAWNRRTKGKLTCIFCGNRSESLDGLKAHSQICEKHPVSELRELCGKLGDALVDYRPLFEGDEALLSRAQDVLNARC